MFIYRKPIKVSVIIPIYNAEAFLADTLNSVLSQTISEIEIICVDDGSTDGCPQILSEYAKKDGRIRVISQNNRYAGVARNNGIKCAAGEYLYFLDADDFVETDMLERTYNYAKEQDCDVVIFGYDKFLQSKAVFQQVNTKRREAFFPNKASFSGYDLVDCGIFQATVGWAWDKLFRRDFVIDNQIFFSDFRTAEDGFFVYTLLMLANRICRIDDILVHHRILGNGSLSTTREMNWVNGIKMVEDIGDEMSRRGLDIIYGSSYKSWVIEYLVWHLNTLTKWEAYSACYRYIAEIIEPRYKVREYIRNEKTLCTQSDIERYEEILLMSAGDYILRRLWWKNKDIERLNNRGWVFPYEKIPKGSNVVLYGAGEIGEAFFIQLKYTNYCRSLAIVDEEYEKKKIKGAEILNPDFFEYETVDYIVISVGNIQAGNEITQYLYDRGVSADKIVRL